MPANTYLCNTRQKSVSNPWKGIIIGTPQGNELGPVLVKVFIDGLFNVTLECKFYNYADENVKSRCRKYIKDVDLLSVDAIKVILRQIP